MSAATQTDRQCRHDSANPLPRSGERTCYQCGAPCVPAIRVTYEVVTPESAKNGDVADRGWIDADGTDWGYDAEDERTLPEQIARYITHSGGAQEASSYPRWHRGVWYTDSDCAYFEQGGERRQSYHLGGLTDVESQEVYRLLTGRVPC